MSRACGSNTPNIAIPKEPPLVRLQRRAEDPEYGSKGRLMEARFWNAAPWRQQRLVWDLRRHFAHLMISGGKRRARFSEFTDPVSSPDADLTRPALDIRNRSRYRGVRR